jgi:hypothetical protein
MLIGDTMRPRTVTSVTLALLAATIGLSMTLSNAVAADAKTSLFKIVTFKDEIIVGLSKADVESLKGENVTAIGRALRNDGELTVWQFAIRKNKDGELEQAPLQRVSLIGHDALRVEPYTSPLKVVPAE